MLYKFRCKNCKRVEEKIMSAKEYEEAIGVCTFCGNVMSKLEGGKDGSRKS